MNWLSHLIAFIRQKRTTRQSFPSSLDIHARTPSQFDRHLLKQYQTRRQIVEQQISEQRLNIPLEQRALFLTTSLEDDQARLTELQAQQASSTFALDTPIALYQKRIAYQQAMLTGERPIEPVHLLLELDEIIANIYILEARLNENDYQK